MRTDKRTDRTGETRIMNNGMAARIIAYRKAVDIDVQFESGDTARSKKYANFLAGSISIPPKRLGEKRKMKNGLLAEIIADNGYHDITLRFENGCVVEGADYACFKRGGVRCPQFYMVRGDSAKVTNPNTKPPTEFWIDLTDVKFVMEHTWHTNAYGYVRSNGDYRGAVLLHRILLDAKGEDFVDHINGDRKNNRRSNLRICNNAQNSANSKKPMTNTSGYKGVHWHRGCKKWRAAIQVNGKMIHLGVFEQKVDAARAYDKAAEKYFGEFAKTNEV